MTLRKLVIVFGVLLLVGGLAWPFLNRFAKLGLGHLPGDISFRRGNVSFYFPLTTCILISIVLSLILWLVRR